MRLVTLLAGTIALLGQDAADWIAMGRGGSVRSVNGPVTITYELGSKQFSAAVVPVDGTVARICSGVRFRVKPDEETRAREHLATG